MQDCLTADSPRPAAVTGTPVTTARLLSMGQCTRETAKLPLPVHAHLPAHSTGYTLANDGADTRSMRTIWDIEIAVDRAIQGACAPSFRSFLAGLFIATAGDVRLYAVQYLIALRANIG